MSDEEVAKLLPAFKAMEYPYGPLLNILLLTGQRVGEVAGMRWDELDIGERTAASGEAFEDRRALPAVWELPPERTKNGRRHVVPLSGPAANILAALPLLGEFVFSFGDRPVRGFSKVKRRLDALSGVTGWRIHDLRRTVATGLARLGTPPHIVSEILGHAPQGITRQVYNRYSYQKEMREALERWAGFVAGGGGEVVTAIGVASLHR